MGKDFDIFEELSNFQIGEKDESFLKFNKKPSKGISEGKETVVKDKTESTAKKLKPSEVMLQDIRNCGFDLSQMEKALKTKGNQLIISCAGSGKTTTLIFKIIYDLKTGWSTKVVEVNNNKVRVPAKIWVSTFLKSGAEELEYSLKKWQSALHQVDTSGSIQFSTLHAEFKRALNAMGVSTSIISAKENSTLLKNVLKPYQLINSKGKPINAEDIRNLESALTRTRNVLDSTRYDSEIYTDLAITHSIIDSILVEWALERKKRGYCDFEDLQEMLYTECYKKNNQEVINFLANRYEFIYVDEFQDTSQIQYKLIKIYAMKCKQVVAIGDDDQTIYSWRGSDNSIITKKFSEDFSPVINQLSINFRCPSNILKVIEPSIKLNKNRFDKELKSSEIGGKVRVAPMMSYSQMVSMLSDCIVNDIKKGYTVAVLCRVNSDGLMPALILDKLNMFSFSISGEGMTLDSYIGRTVLSIVKLFTEKYSQSVKNALNMLTWNQYSVNNLIRVCQSNKLSIWDVDEKDLSYSCPDIAGKILTWRSIRKSSGDIEALKYILQDYRLHVFSSDNQFNSVTRSVIASIEALLEYFDYDYVEDFLYELEDINERLKARKKKKGVSVQIATVHEFKGKEADSVYVWNDSEDVFPQKNAVSEGEYAIEEERRVHYIACTRAKKVCTIVYKFANEGMFIGEMDLAEAEIMRNDVGAVMGSLKKEAKENKNLRDFEKSALKKSEEDIHEEEKVEKKIKKETQNYIENLIPYVDDNEFWGGDDGI